MTGLQILIDKHIDKRDIEDIIFSMGFKKLEYENVYFMYKEDFVSIEGCWFRLSYDSEIIYEGENKIFKTECVTSTSDGRSYDDLQIQIDTIKKIEEAFGGIVYSDWGKGYFENHLPKLSKTEIACGLTYNSFKRNLAMAEKLIEEVESEVLLYHDFGMQNIYDKNLLRNNNLIPFLVSIMENFLKSFVHSYILTNKEAENLIFKNKEKLSYSEVKYLLNNEKSIIDITLDNKFYSFQNFNSANKAYTKYINIDLFKDVLSTKIEVDEKELTLISILSELLAKRHKLIHEAELDYSLDKSQMEKYLNSIKELGATFVKVFKEKKNIRIDLENQIQC